jgi:hypothetical protein
VVPGGLTDKNVNFLWDEKEAKNSYNKMKVDYNLTMYA